MKKLIMFAFITLLMVSTSVFAQEMIEKKQSIEVLETTVNPQTGEEEPTVVLVKNKNGNQTIIGLDQDPEVAKIRAILAFRLKFPELLGVRAGINIDQTVDIGMDAGFGVFFNNIGGFINYYPAGKSKKSIRNLYLGGRFQKEMIFAIFAWESGYRTEGIVGYKFDKKPGGFHSFIEGGMGIQTGPMRGQAWGTGETQTYEPFALPVVNLGIGWTIPSSN